MCQQNKKLCVTCTGMEYFWYLYLKNETASQRQKEEHFVLAPDPKNISLFRFIICFFVKGKIADHLTKNTRLWKKSSRSKAELISMQWWDLFFPQWRACIHVSLPENTEEHWVKGSIQGKTHFTHQEFSCFLSEDSPEIEESVLHLFCSNTHGFAKQPFMMSRRALTPLKPVSEGPRKEKSQF